VAVLAAFDVTGVRTGRSPGLRGNVGTMDALTCPRCGAEMVSRPLADGEVSQCPDGHGVFLSRADLGSLIESETDWHRNASQHTAPLPRITADMTAPPSGQARARAWVETLFN
jgi:Zn-finger nucleic acid-binding protein